jgi:hypothetical protein
MSRTFLMFFTTICWLGIAADAIVHLVAGDLSVPIGMAAAFAVWATLWRLHYGARPQVAEARVPVEA